MIKVSDLVNAVLSKLVSLDDDSGYSESEIRYYLNQAIKALAVRLELFIKEVEYECVDDINCFTFVSDLLRPKKVLYNGKELRLLSYAEYQKVDDIDASAIIFIDHFELSFKPKRGDKLTLVYSGYESIKDNDTYININPICEEALGYFALYKANEKVLSDKHIQRSQYFKKLFEEEIKALASSLSYTKPKNLKTKYIKV